MRPYTKRFIYAPDPERPARVVEMKIIQLGSQTKAAIYSAHILCDDGQVRLFQSDGEGRWVREGE